MGLSEKFGLSQNEFPILPFNFLGMEGEPSSYQKSAVTILPIPYDATASFNSGARWGPEAIISVSRELEEYDIELKWDPSSKGIYTEYAIEPHMGGPEKMMDRVTSAVAPLVDDGKLVVTLGGDHSVTIGAVKAFVSKYKDLSVLYLDAHGDLRHTYMGTTLGHASVARRLLEMCTVVLVGVRNMSAEESEFIDTNKIPCYSYIGMQKELPIDSIIGSLSSNVYISIDLDVFDPSIMAAVGNPVPGGIGWYEMLRLLYRVTSARNIVGFDVMELVPNEGPKSCAFTAASLVYKLIGYCLTTEHMASS